jgi:hypothetical protein
MVGLSFCDFAGTREEKAMMAAYRKKEWPRRYKVMQILRNLLDYFFPYIMKHRNYFILTNLSSFLFACRMDPTCGHWRCRSEKKDVVLLSLVR